MTIFIERSMVAVYCIFLFENREIRDELIIEHFKVGCYRQRRKIMLSSSMHGRGACVELLWSCTLHVADVLGCVGENKARKENGQVARMKVSLGVTKYYIFTTHKKQRNNCNMVIRHRIWHRTTLNTSDIHSRDHLSV